MGKRYIINGVWSLLFIFPATAAWAHDPVFGPGPHVLYKDGVEIHLEVSHDKQDKVTRDDQTLTLKYGLTGDWVIGIDLPYQQVRNSFATQKGFGDTTLSTKYRFWRKDGLGTQETAAVLLRLKLDSSSAAVSTDTTDVIAGFTYGYESLKWYRWASVRYRFNQRRGGLHRGNRLFVDGAIGYRSEIHDYRAPDTVWLLELNGEIRERNAVNGIDIAASGGSRWFVSPGIQWTVRNFSVKAGVQIPLWSNLDRNQPGSDYRARLELEVHL